MLKTLKKYKIPYLFISPFFILFLLFQLIPVLWTFGISFTSWNGMKTPKFIGLDNYNILFQDYMFKETFTNTVIYWVVSTILILVISTAIALCLNSTKLRSRNFFSVATYLPYVCASVAMGLIFSMLFDEQAGLINAILETFGGSKIPWLTSSKYDRIPVIILFVWRIVPWFTVIILSGLKNISKEYYEAATVDGASIFQQFTKITLPLLGNIYFFCIVTITADVWKMFNESYTLAGPGTSNATIFQLIYQYAFQTHKLGYASALSVLLIAIMLIVSVVQFKVRRRSGEL